MKYSDELELKYKAKIRNLLTELPDYMSTYIEGRRESLAVKTRYAYLMDLKFFLEYEKKYNPLYKDTELKDIPIDLFENLTPQDIIEFFINIEDYEVNGKIRTNGKVSKQRKLATLRAFYKFCNVNGLIKSNPTMAIENIKVETEDIVAMETDEVQDFLSVVRNGTGMKGKRLAIQKKNADRDLTIYTLLLGTGIRISEMVGINADEVDLVHKQFRVTRKGGKNEIIHFGEDVKVCLENYLANVRPKYITPDSEQRALFLSLKGQRLSVRRVEKMTKTYAEIALPAKHITPHKMRSTFGTFLYNETEDPGLVAKMLGHNSVDTTLKRYAKLDKKRKEKAAEIVSDLLK